MFSVVKLAKEAKQFEEDTAFFRELEKSLQEPQHGDDGTDTPVFNKRLFSSQGSYYPFKPNGLAYPSVGRVHFQFKGVGWHFSFTLQILIINYESKQ